MHLVEDIGIRERETGAALVGQPGLRDGYDWRERQANQCRAARQVDAGEILGTFESYRPAGSALVARHRLAAAAKFQRTLHRLKKLLALVADVN